MNFQALLVSKDPVCSATVSQILSGFHVDALVCGYPEALCQLTDHSFDAVLVDFDDPHSASLILESACQARENKRVAIALIADDAKARAAFGAGANFVLHKPVAEEAAHDTFRTMTALLQRERRRSFRVPVQVPVALKIAQGKELEAILLDLSEDGVDLVASQPLCPSSIVTMSFQLPGESRPVEAAAEVAWANPNGQSGAQFVDLPASTHAALRAWLAGHAPVPPPEDPEPVSDCTLSDLSSGGCYVQTSSPFPERAGIVLSLRIEPVEVKAEGVVRVMHPGYGMGVEFVLRTPEQQQRVTNFISLLTSQPGMRPELRISPKSLTAQAWQAQEPADGFDPLLDLLRHHESMSQDEFLTALRGQRGSPDTVSA